MWVSAMKGLFRPGQVLDTFFGLRCCACNVPVPVRAEGSVAHNEQPHLLIEQCAVDIQALAPLLYHSPAIVRKKRISQYGNNAPKYHRYLGRGRRASKVAMIPIARRKEGGEMGRWREGGGEGGSRKTLKTKSSLTSTDLSRWRC